MVKSISAFVIPAPSVVIPAKAGTQDKQLMSEGHVIFDLWLKTRFVSNSSWAPAFAGMTRGENGIAAMTTFSNYMQEK